MDEIANLTTALLDRYEIVRELGAGGMATVYLARDLKHERLVALKVLKPELAAVIGGDRFLREIKTTANLQHPHILALFDSGAVNGTVFYAMPFVDGESLRDRLNREKQLAIDDALRIAREVADALQYAHDRGVIHRDIKPENILLQGGHALVADFGIALAASTIGGTRMTETGMSLGTPTYMSPEQAMGERTLDARTDIYALGCVTYEMLAGEAPFSGTTAQAIVAKVLTEKPASLIARRDRVPPQVEDAVLTALEKLPADRFASAAQFAAALDTPKVTHVTRSAAATATTPRSSINRDIIVGATSFMLAAAAFYTVRTMSLGSDSPIAGFGQSTKITFDEGVETLPALSPDGKSVAYVVNNEGDWRIYVRQVAGGRTVRLTNDSGSIEADPQWSRDGTRILFLGRWGVLSASAGGGDVRPEVPAPTNNFVAAAVWSSDGKSIAYVVGDSLLLWQDQRRSRVLFVAPELRRCMWSPSGKHIACAQGNMSFVATEVRIHGNIAPSRIVVIAVSDGSASIASDSSSVNHNPVWSSDGRWLYFVSTRDGPRDVYASRIDRNGRMQGAPIRLTTGLDAMAISLSADGTRLAYAMYRSSSNAWTLPIPSSPPTSTATATPLTSGEQTITTLDASIGGRWLYYVSDVSGKGQLYRMALPHGEVERLTSDDFVNIGPAISPDGRELAFHSIRTGSRKVFVMPLDGGAVQQVTSDVGVQMFPSWAPDGRALAYADVNGNLFVVKRNANQSWGAPVQRDSGMFSAWSPDGRSIATSTLGIGKIGGSILIVAPDSGAARIVYDPALHGGLTATDPKWSADGRTVYFRTSGQNGRAAFWSVPTEGGTPKLLVKFDDTKFRSYWPQWDVQSGQFYFTVAERFGDIWVMEIVRP